MNGLFRRYKTVLSYLCHSILSTLVDTLTVWLLLNKFNIDITVSNTCGVAVGFLIGFFLDVKRSFMSSYTPITFLIYFGTFILGLVLADALITVCYISLEKITIQAWAFLISKGVSVIVPFFVMYFIRKYAYLTILKGKNKNE